jgi:hypothetical protein
MTFVVRDEFFGEVFLQFSFSSRAACLAAASALFVFSVTDDPDDAPAFAASGVEARTFRSTRHSSLI